MLDDATKGRAAATKAHILGVFDQLAKANNGRVFNVSEGSYLDHPAGGCRMGTDPATSVCDSAGRTHDHENLFVVGSPTLPTGGCTNATFTFVALTLRSADPPIAKSIDLTGKPGHSEDACDYFFAGSTFSSPSFAAMSSADVAGLIVFSIAEDLAVLADVEGPAVRHARLVPARRRPWPWPWSDR